MEEITIEEINEKSKSFNRTLKMIEDERRRLKNLEYKVNAEIKEYFAEVDKQYGYTSIGWVKR